MQLSLFEAAGLNQNGHTLKRLSYDEILEVYRNTLVASHLERPFPYRCDMNLTVEYFLTELEKAMI